MVGLETTKIAENHEDHYNLVLGNEYTHRSAKGA